MFAEVFNWPQEDAETVHEPDHSWNKDRENVITYVPEEESLAWRRIALWGWATAGVATSVCALCVLGRVHGF
jgi:hypothetical protein